jgi:chemotaxis protein CheY-P-specific phosphatase CheC
MSTPVTLTPDELDFMAEMMNVGTCYAGSALTKLLDVDVEVAVPELSVLSVDEAATARSSRACT